MNYILLIIVAVVSFVIGRSSVKKTNFASNTEDEMEAIRKEAREAVTERTEMRKERIILLMKLDACDVAKAKHGIVREDVEKLLGVAAGTARKYLNELEDENKITQIGDRGADVYYTLNTSN